MMEFLYEGLINFVYYVIFSGLLWGVIKLFGQGWVKSQFNKALVRYTSEQQLAASEKLEAIKKKYAQELADKQAEYMKELAEQQKEYTAQIETLKNQLAFSLARKTKFAEKEFEVLECCWHHFMKAYDERRKLQMALAFADYEWKNSNEDKRAMLSKTIGDTIDSFTRIVGEFIDFYRGNLPYIASDIQGILDNIGKTLVVNNKDKVSISSLVKYGERLKEFMIDWNSYERKIEALKGDLEEAIHKRLFSELN